MADLSKIKLPSGSEYNLKDATARSSIEALTAGGVQFIICKTLDNTPNIVPGGTLAPSSATSGKFYLVQNGTFSGSYYDEYITVFDNRVLEGANEWSWEKIGNTGNVTFDKKTANVLGANASFTNSSSNVSLGAPTKDKVLGENTTFSLTNGTVTNTPTTTKVLGKNTTAKVPAHSASIGAATKKYLSGTITLNRDSPENVVKAYNNTTKVNITGVGASTISVPSITKSTNTISFGVNNETLEIAFSGGHTNSFSADTVTIGTAGDAATKASSPTNVMTGLGTPTTITVDSITNATLSLALNDTSSSGSTQVVTGIPTSASISEQSVTITSNDVNAYTGLSSSVGTGITVGTNDIVDVVTALPTSGNTAAAQTITVGKDSKTVLTDQTSATFGN